MATSGRPLDRKEDSQEPEESEPDGASASASVVELPTTLRTLNGKVEVRGDSLCVIPHEGTKEMEQDPAPTQEVAQVWGEVIPGEISDDILIHEDYYPVPRPEILAEAAVADIIESAEHLFGLVEVDEPPVVIDQSEEEVGDPRHDSGIIAGIDEDDKGMDEEETAGCGWEGVGRTSGPVPSLAIVEYKGGRERADSLGKPPTVMGPSYLIALRGEHVFLRIKYNGIPQPTVEWTRNVSFPCGVPARVGMTLFG